MTFILFLDVIVASCRDIFRSTFCSKLSSQGHCQCEMVRILSMTQWCVDKVPRRNRQRGDTIRGSVLEFSPGFLPDGEEMCIADVVQVPPYTILMVELKCGGGQARGWPLSAFSQLMEFAAHQSEGAAWSFWMGRWTNIATFRFWWIPCYHGREGSFAVTLCLCKKMPRHM